MTRLKTILGGVIAIYVIALTIFHFNYTYVDYMREEYEIIIFATLIYCIFIALIACIVYGKKGGFKKEISQASVDNLIQSIDKTKENNCNVKTNNFIGTGIIGLTRYATFCKIAGLLGLFVGVLCVFISIKEGSAIFIYGLYSIVCGSSCLLSILFVNALVTIAKAAKIYIDNNQNK